MTFASSSSLPSHLLQLTQFMVSACSKVSQKRVFLLIISSERIPPDESDPLEPGSPGFLSQTIPGRKENSFSPMVPAIQMWAMVFPSTVFNKTLSFLDDSQARSLRSHPVLHLRNFNTVPSNSIQWSSLQKFQHLQIPPSCDISHEV